VTVNILQSKHHPVFVHVGSELRLTCRVSHPPAVFGWSRNVSHQCDDVTEHMTNTTDGFSVDSGSAESGLIRHSVQWNDETQYACKGYQMPRRKPTARDDVHVAVVDSKLGPFVV